MQSVSYHVHILHFVLFPSLHSIQALADCAKDLLSPFQSDNIDLVAGIDAMGFILGKKAKNFTFRGKIQGEFRETKLKSNFFLFLF